MTAARITRALLVLLVTLLALAPRALRPAAADGIAAPGVVAGSRYVLVNPPIGHGACLQGLLSRCRTKAGAARLAPIRVHVGPARLPASASPGPGSGPRHGAGAA